jgi:hypothetical protein
MFVAGNKLAVTLIWRGTIPGRTAAWRRPASPSRSATQRSGTSGNGKVAEILTLQDQFAILRQIGYLPECVHAA